MTRRIVTQSPIIASDESLRDFTSELTAIPGVGDKRKGRLLRHFGSIQRISRASVSELTPFVGKKTAEEIAGHFERQKALADTAALVH